MKKRGQLTTFIIVGIVALFILGFIFFARNVIIEKITSATNVERYMRIQMDSIKKEIASCVDVESREALEILGKQGGYFEPRYYLSYYGNMISFLCMDIPGDPRCRNNMLTEEKIEKQLNERLEDELKNCINLRGFATGKLYDYELIYDMNSLVVESEVNLKNVLVNVNFPVMVKRDEFELSEEDFISSVDIPMGEVLSVVKDIVNSETIVGSFVLNTYDLSRKPLYFLRRHYSEDNKIYLIKVIEGGYIFNFAIEDKE